jgi:hypothetical protein
LHNQNGQHLNVSNQYKAVQAWAKATMFYWKIGKNAELIRS